MTPTPAQILQAMANHSRPGRTHDARVRDALLHVRQSTIKKPGFEAGFKDIYSRENFSTSYPHAHLQ
jgi:hypothetical protein